MAAKKKPVDPARIRAIPKEGFSWIDRRFVREGLIDALPREAILLYFLLVAVSDARGLSFYADPTIRKILKLDGQELTQSRERLIHAELILYRYPIYQVLPIPRRQPAVTRESRDATPRGGEPLSLREIFQLAGFTKAGEDRSQEREDRS